MSDSDVTAITLDNGIKLNSDQMKVLKNGLSEMTNSSYRKQAEIDLQKQISTRIKEELDGAIPVKLFNKLAHIAYKDDAKKIDQEVTEVLDLAQALNLYNPDEDQSL